MLASIPPTSQVPCTFANQHHIHQTVLDLLDSPLLTDECLIAPYLHCPLIIHLGVRLVPFLLLSNPISRLSWRITTRATAPRIWRIISLTLDESDGQASRVCTKHSLHELVSASFLPLLIVFVVSFLLFPPIFCFLFCLTV
jgi:hypothetical protein